MSYPTLIITPHRAVFNGLLASKSLSAERSPDRYNSADNLLDRRTGNVKGQGAHGSRSKKGQLVKVSLKIMILAGGLMTTSSCICFLFAEGVGVMGRPPARLELCDERDMK